MLLRRGFHGWRMLAGLSAAELVSWGILYYSFAALVRPVESDTGWSRTQVTGAFSLALLVSGLAAVPVGHWIDRRGTRALMTGGALFGAGSLALLSRVTSLPAWYATWAALGVVMAMVLYEPAFAVVATWFVRHRDRALTVLTVGAGLASTLVVPLATWLVAIQGWRGAVLTFAAVLACTTLPVHAFVLRNAPEDLGQHPDGDAVAPAVAPAPRSEGIRVVLAEPRFWRLTVALTLASLVTVATTVHLIPCLTGRGLSPAQAGLALGATGLMQLPGRLVFGPIRRRLAWPLAMTAALALQASALVVLAVGSRLETVALFAGLFGLGSGIATLVRASTLAEIYGVTRYGRVGGVVSLCTTLGRSAGPVLGSIALAASGGYGTVLAALAGVLGVAIAIVLVPWHPSRSSAEPNPLTETLA
jgi:MFS family permease